MDCHAFDPAAPVLVCKIYEEVLIVNDKGVPTTSMVVDGVQLLRLNGDAGSNSVMLPITRENDYVLNYISQTKQLWIQTPADYEGKVYTFSWLTDF